MLFLLFSSNQSVRPVVACAILLNSVVKLRPKTYLTCIGLIWLKYPALDYLQR